MLAVSTARIQSFTVTMILKSTIVKYIEKFRRKIRSSYSSKTNLYMVLYKLSHHNTMYLIFNKFCNKLKGTFVDSKFTFDFFIREQFVIHSSSPSMSS